MKREIPRSIMDQQRFDDTGKQPAFRSKNPHVPKEYRLDLAFNCFTNAKNLAKMNPKLIYREGYCREKGKKGEWGNHAWCETAQGEIVDPYFEWKFPGEKLIYREERISVRFPL
jgi:hypothetical protein